MTKLLQVRWELDKQLRDDYTAMNNPEKSKAFSTLKSIPTMFFSVARSWQKTRAKVGPFVNPETGKPNPNPACAAESP